MSARGSYRSRLPRVPSIFCPTSAAQEVVRDLPPLTVLRAPRGFGKTSTVAFWLRSGALDDRAAAWINLNRPTDAEELWAALHDTLVAAELAAPEAAPGPESVTDALRHLTQRLVLVVDGLHHVQDTTVDRTLVEIIQAHELVHVVATSRVERPITSIGTTTVDTRVLDVAELVLTVDEALLLAEQLGLDAARDDVARLVAEYAGWPALVRAALLDTRRGPDGRLVTDRAAASRYAALVLSDPELAPWHDIVTGLAVPDLLRREDLPALFEDPEDRAAAEVVLEHSFTLVRSDEGFRYPAGLRHALLEHLAAERPERYRELNERLGRLRRAQHDPVAALEYARRAQAWPLALLVLEEHWAQLLRRHTDHVRAAVLTMPRDLVRSSPRLVVARDHILDRDVPHQAEAALRGGLLLPGRTLPAHALTTTQHLALRFETNPTYGASEVLLGHLDSSLTPGRRADMDPETCRAAPELLTEWALSLLYDNDGVQAAYAFALACRCAEALGDAAAAREAAGGVALSLALLGHTRWSDRWTRHMASFDTQPAGLELIAAPLTRTVLAALRLEEVSWPELPDVHSPGLTPLVEVSRLAASFGDILMGRLGRARSELERHTAQHLEDVEEVLRAAVLALRVDLALADGRIDRAGAYLAEANGDGAWNRASRARHAFYVGAYAETLRLTEDAAAYAGLRPRVGLELLLLHACAALRAGDRDAAVDHLATAVGIGSDTEVLLPFLTVPRSDLEAIAEPGSWARTFLDSPPLTGRDTVFPEPLRVEQLSAAELRVLRELSDGLPLAHIGRRLYLSESTVKTHVRRIYRKLGVTSRGEAVTRARELALLEDQR